MERFNFKVRPSAYEEIDPEALKVGNVTREEIMAYPTKSEVYPMLVAMMHKYVDVHDNYDKFFLVGYNIASFDQHFLRAFFVRMGDDNFPKWFWSATIDVMVLAAQKLMMERREMKNFKQSTVASWLGIEVDETKLHDADYDIELLVAIYKKVI